MSPFHLRNRPAVKKRFLELIVNHIKFVDSFSDPFITHEFLRMYHRKKSVNAALNGFVDDVIEPSSTRARLVDAFNMLQSKRETRPGKKHGNIPL